MWETVDDPKFYAERLSAVKVRRLWHWVERAMTEKELALLESARQFVERTCPDLDVRDARRVAPFQLGSRPRARGLARRDARRSDHVTLMRGAAALAVATNMRAVHFRQKPAPEPQRDERPA